MQLPKMPRGRPTEKARQRYDAELSAFASSILKINSTLDFKVSSRGWCYILENMGVINKGDFDAAQTVINDCRRAGILPIDICLEDSAREFNNIQYLDNADHGEYLEELQDKIFNTLDDYTPFGFWDDKAVYIEMLVEKIDLKSLFNPICAKYHVPLANARGWSDINTRAEMMGRFKQHEAAGRRCYLLYCGDHDPAGLDISNKLIKNFHDLRYAVEWHPGQLTVERFGLNYDFIEQYNLLWIDNLETGSGKNLADPKHKDFNQDYVQDYLKRYGARKVEANALVIQQQAGRQLCEDAIQAIIQDPSAVDKYTQELNIIRKTLLSKYKSQ